MKTNTATSNKQNSTSKFSHLYLLSCKVFGAPKDVGFRDALSAKLMNMHHFAESDQADKRIRRQKTKRHLERFL